MNRISHDQEAQNTAIVILKIDALYGLTRALRWSYASQKYGLPYTSIRDVHFPYRSRRRQNLAIMN